VPGLQRYGNNDSAKWDKPDIYGATALMKASGLGRKLYVEELLKAGADPNIKDHDGKTALDYAKQYDQYDIADILTEAVGSGKI
jgi:ankyrin repeat protein